ncbi:MAG: energy transducer TonB [Pseudomonadota bacterium]
MAIAISALIHSWLAAGIKVEATRRAAARPYTAISARLEPAAPSVPLTLSRTSSASVSAPAADNAVTRVVEDTAGRDLPGVPRSTVAEQSPGPPMAPEIPAAPASGPTLPPIPDPVYYPARQLDVYPALLEPIRLAYPEHALRGEVSGKVTVLLLIDDNGLVNEVSVVEAEPAGYFEEAARAAFSEIRFTPARKDGRAVKSRVLISVSYGAAQPQNALR